MTFVFINHPQFVRQTISYFRKLYEIKLNVENYDKAKTIVEVAKVKGSCLCPRWFWLHLGFPACIKTCQLG